ncbi:hypothetical protein V1504DRAFT_279082 [Lipomyces starkeyi]
MESSSADKVQITASEFVSAYASINVVNNILFARAWPNHVNGKTSFADGIGQHSVRGNSRDDPTPLEFHCRKTPMCPYRHIRRNSIAEHELFCSETLVARAVAKEEAGTKFSCDCSGCSEAFVRRCLRTSDRFTSASKRRALMAAIMARCTPHCQATICTWTDAIVAGGARSVGIQTATTTASTMTPLLTVGISM